MTARQTLFGASMRTAAAGALICVVSWFALAIGAGNVGLQQAVANGPGTLVDRPLAVLLVAASSFASAFALGARLSASSSRLLGAVLAWDLFGAIVLAPLAIGELTPADAPIIFIALTVAGVQPAGVLIGSWLGRRYGRIVATG